MIDNLKEAIAHAKGVAEMQRQEAEELREYGEHLSPPSQPYNLVVKACIECANDHEQLAAWLEELAERREADRWNVIRTKADLPKENGKCLVSLDFGDVSIDYYDKDWGFVCYIGNVIAWRPLPKPYESEDK